MEIQKGGLIKKPSTGSIDKLWPDTQNSSFRFNIDNIAELSLSQANALLVLDSKTKISFNLTTPDQRSFFSDIKSIVN